MSRVYSENVVKRGRLTQRRDYGRDHAQRMQRRLSTPPFSASLPRAAQQRPLSGLRLTFFTILQWQCEAHRSTSMFAGVEFLRDLSCKLQQNLANALKPTGSASTSAFCGRDVPADDYTTILGHRSRCITTLEAIRSVHVPMASALSATQNSNSPVWI